jgi:ankyrin repeat protein
MENISKKMKTGSTSNPNPNEPPLPPQSQGELFHKASPERNSTEKPDENTQAPAGLFLNIGKVCFRGDRKPLLYIIPSPDMSQSELFHEAVVGNNTTTVRAFLDKPNINVNTPDGYEFSPLCSASNCGDSHIEVVKLLLAHPQIDVNRIGKDSENSLYLAAQNGYADIVKLLLKHPNIDVNIANRYGYSPLYIASENNHAKIVKLLLNFPKIDPNKSDVQRLSPLHIACLKGHIDIVKLLLKHPNIEVNRPTITGDTPLYLAVEKGHIDIVKQLLQHTDINKEQADESGKTPLLLAVEKAQSSNKTEQRKTNYIKIVSLLLE